jgi:hypothetical protein
VAVEPPDRGEIWGLGVFLLCFGLSRWVFGQFPHENFAQLVPGSNAATSAKEYNRSGPIALKQELPTLDWFFDLHNRSL